VTEKEPNRKREVLIFILEFSIIFILFIVMPFLFSGVWPPFVNVISDSMEPNVNTGDMVYIVDNERYTNNSLYGGVHTSEHQSRDSFNKKGDVIVFYPNGHESEVPVIHRAKFYVEEGEDWTDRGKSSYLSNSDCSEITHCPAPNSGLITKGDNNNYYDQAGQISSPVKEDWIVGRASYRIPYLGDLSIN